MTVVLVRTSAARVRQDAGALVRTRSEAVLTGAMGEVAGLALAELRLPDFVREAALRATRSSKN
ncbi:MAG: hypothetical protein WA087_00715 [Candidatus Saccharimonadales bacterium]